MKSKEFNISVSRTFGIPEKTITSYTRFLKEAGLLTTGARGVNAPDMTPLDAARVTIALLTCSRPGQAVERVKQFGKMPCRSDCTPSANGFAIISEKGLKKRFEGETLENVLTFFFDRENAIGLVAAVKWYVSNDFSLEVSDSLASSQGVVTTRSVKSSDLVGLALDLARS
jgi:hypothetical protein